MKTILKISFIFFLAFFYNAAAAGQDFVYKPINPAFGGDTFNYNWLLSSASSQNNTTDPSQEDRTNSGNGSNDPLDNFTESLNRQLLNQLSRSLLNTQFGSDGLEEGSYSIGNFDINVIDIGEGLSITIFDNSSGSETQIIVPYF